MDPNQQPQPQQPPQSQPQYPQPSVEQPVPPVTPPPLAAPVAPPIDPAVNPVQHQPFGAQSDLGGNVSPPKNGTNPGTALGVVSFVLLFVGLGLISLILGIIGLKKSQRSGRKNVFAVIGIVGGILEIIAAVVVGVFFAMHIMTTVDTCREYGSGTHILLDGEVITCNI